MQGTKRMVGYAVPSTEDETNSKQLAVFAKIGIHRSAVFVEEGSEIEDALARPVFRRCLESLRTGDTLVILSRSALGIDSNADAISSNIQERGVILMPLMVPGKPGVQGVARRTKDGAPVTGKFMGPVPLVSWSQVMTAYERHRRDGTSVAALAAEFGVTRQALYKRFPSDRSQGAEPSARQSAARERMAKKAAEKAARLRSSVPPHT